MRRQPGQLLIELLISFAILGITIPVILGMFITSNQTVSDQSVRRSASSEIVSIKEAVRQIRETGWSNVANPGTYHVEYQSGIWTLQTGVSASEPAHAIEIEDVYRDQGGEIVTSGGTLDPSTKKVTVSVSWTYPDSDTLVESFYLTRYLDNLEYTETDEAVFQLGDLEGTAVINNYGGEVILGSGGKGDWCKPNDYIVAELDLPGNGKAAVVEAIEGKVFTGTDDRNQGQFFELAVTQDDPPGVSIESSVNGYDTNDIFIDENYAYVATDDVSRDVIIIDLNTGQEVGYYNDNFWWGVAQGVFVRGNVGYAVIGPNLHTFDLSSKTGQRTELDSVSLSPYWWWPATGYRVQVVGDYAYVALDWGSAELRIVNVANSSNIYREGTANVNAERGKDVWVNETGTRVYLATEYSPSYSELFIIDTTSKSGNRPLIASYDAQGMNPKDLILVSENKLLLGGTGGEEYQVIDIANESSLQKCGGLNVDSGVYGVSGVLEEDGEAFAYIVTKDAGNEFKVIEGGAGESFASEGTFTSQVLDFGYTTAFNYSTSSLLVPNQTTAMYQIAIADPVNGNCEEAAYSYVGPDGTSNTFYTEDASVPLDDDGSGYENPGRCMRYKVFMETADSSSTPVLQDMSINYSP